MRIDDTQPAIYSGIVHDSLSPVRTGQPAVEENDDRHPQDLGCQYSESCLICPLPKCKHEMTMGQVKIEVKKAESRKQVAFIIENRLSIQEAAERLNVSERTIFRMMERARETWDKNQQRPEPHH